MGMVLWWCFFSFGAYKCFIFSSSVCVCVCAVVFYGFKHVKEKIYINKTAFYYSDRIFLFRVNYFRYHTNTLISPSAPAEATYPLFGWNDAW